MHCDCHLRETVLCGIRFFPVIENNFDRDTDIKLLIDLLLLDKKSFPDEQGACHGTGSVWLQLANILLCQAFAIEVMQLTSLDGMTLLRRAKAGSTGQKIVDVPSELSGCIEDALRTGMVRLTA
jgi:hypothetical protein